MAEDKGAKKSVVAKKIRHQRAAVALIALLALLAVSLFTPLFAVKSITVEGNSVLNAEDIVKVSGIKTGDNVFRINTSEAKEKIKSLGYVESALIKRKFPSKIVIEVKECSEDAYVLFAGNYIGVDSEFKVISVLKASEKNADKPVISGMALKKFDKGAPLVAAKDSKLNATKKLVALLKSEKFLSKTEKIKITDANKISMTLDTGTVVSLGNSDKLDYKLSYLKEVLENLDNQRGGEIDMSDTENVNYKGGN